MRRQRTADCGSIGLLILAGVIALWQPAMTPAAPKVPRTIETSGVDFVTPAAQQSIDRGLAFLATHQNDDGSFGSGTVFSHNIAVTALSAIAFVSAGNTPERGKYGKTVARALQYILQHVGPNGFRYRPRHQPAWSDV